MSTRREINQVARQKAFRWWPERRRGVRQRGTTVVIVPLPALSVWRAEAASVVTRKKGTRSIRTPLGAPSRRSEIRVVGGDWRRMAFMPSNGQ
jgi:hypothetical protein